jgi:hypothetical protein
MSLGPALETSISRYFLLAVSASPPKNLLVNNNSEFEDVFTRLFVSGSRAVKVQVSTRGGVGGGDK